MKAVAHLSDSELLRAVEEAAIERTPAADLIEEWLSRYRNLGGLPVGWFTIERPIRHA